MTESILPEIKILPEKKLVGKRMLMSFSNNGTGDLWRSFMPVKNEIENHKGTDLYSVQIYAPAFFDDFNPDTVFEKWAAIEVTSFRTIPSGMETLVLKGGLYAVFLYKGAANESENIFRYILQTWLPGSEYLLDNRPHFEILGDKYKNNDPASEEEIWIPVKPKTQHFTESSIVFNQII